MGEPSQDAPTERSERLWQHYQRPVKNSWPQDRLRMRRYEWLMELLRLDIPLETLAVATALAMLGNADGSRMVPADPRFLNAVDLSYRQAVGTHLAGLRDLGFLTLTQRAGGRTGNPAHVFHLSMPADASALPYRLDGDYERFEERRKGTAPVKAIEASKAARIERKRTSGETPAAEGDDRKGTSGETPADNADDRKRPSSETGAATGFDRNSTSTETPFAPADDRNAASSETNPAGTFDRNHASNQSPVDNSLHQKPASSETASQEPTDRKPASGETEFDWKASTLSLEGQHTFTGSAASDSVVNNPLTPTTSVVSIGGDPTDARDETTDANPESSFTAAEYTAAKDLIYSLPRDQADALMEAAVAELRAAREPRSSRLILIRAAQIAARPEWDTA